MVCDLRITPYSYNQNDDTSFTIFFYQGPSPIQGSDLQGLNECMHLFIFYENSFVAAACTLKLKAINPSYLKNYVSGKNFMKLTRTQMQLNAGFIFCSL